MNKKKIRVIIFSLLVLFLIAPLTFFLLYTLKNPANNGPIIFDNLSSYNKNINSDVFANISKTLYVNIKYNIDNPEDIYHATIRDNTFKNTSNSISFTVDIPLIQMSWYVSQNISSNGEPFSDAYIGCMSEEDAIYPVTTCLDQDNGFMTDEESTLLEITRILPLAGPSYKVSYSITDKKITLIITYYTSTGNEDALKAIKSLGYDPSNYTINYINKS